MQRDIQTQQINIFGSSIKYSNISTVLDVAKMLFLELQKFIHENTRYVYIFM